MTYHSSRTTLLCPIKKRWQNLYISKKEILQEVIRHYKELMEGAESGHAFLQDYFNRFVKDWNGEV